MGPRAEARGRANTWNPTVGPASVVRQLHELGREPASVEVRRGGEKDDRAMRSTSTVAEDGSFAVPSLEPGDWRLRVRYRVSGHPVETEPLALLMGLREGEVREVSLDVSGLAHAPCTGSVKVNDAPHVGAFTIQVERRGSDEQVHVLEFAAHTDAAGGFRCLLPPGRRRVLVEVGDEAACLSPLPSDFVDASVEASAHVDFRIDAVVVDVVTRRADGELLDAPWEILGERPRSWLAHVAPGTWRAVLAPGRYEVAVRRAGLLDFAQFRAWALGRLERGVLPDALDIDVPAGEIVVPAGQARARVEIVVPEAAGY